MPFPFMAAAVLGSAALGAWSAKSAQDDANRTNVNLQRENQSWEENLANTAHQREVADLKAAGLNPILSARLGGSATPVVAPARVESLAPTYLNSAKQFGDAALNTRSLQADLMVKASQVEANSAQATQSRAQANLTNTSAQGVAMENAVKKAEMIKRIREAIAKGIYPQWMYNMDNIYKGSIDRIVYPFEKTIPLLKGTSAMPHYNNSEVYGEWRR